MIRYVINGTHLPAYIRFKAALRDPQRAQMKRLFAILKTLEPTAIGQRFRLGEIRSYADFVHALPPTDYAFWERDILAQRAGATDCICSKVVRFESAGELNEKYIPYPKTFLAEIRKATQPWLITKKGKQPFGGIWTPEGVVTIPYKGKYPAAITGHFLEWMDLHTQQVFPTWELQCGQAVQPMISGSHGLLRYKLSEILVVRHMLYATPCFDHLGHAVDADVHSRRQARVSEG